MEMSLKDVKLNRRHGKEGKAPHKVRLNEANAAPAGGVTCTLHALRFAHFQHAALAQHLSERLHDCQGGQSRAGGIRHAAAAQVGQTGLRRGGPQQLHGWSGVAVERLPLSARDAQRSAQVGGTSALATQQHTCLVARRGRRLDALEAELGGAICRGIGPQQGCCRSRVLQLPAQPNACSARALEEEIVQGGPACNLACRRALASIACSCRSTQHPPTKDYLAAAALAGRL